MEKEIRMCCEELKLAIEAGDLRYNNFSRDICIGTNVIWYCPFCGEEICWRWTK